eukprot:SAG11_NODE_542_length_8640_cov_5.667603_12_plen_52_part_00
MIQYGETEPDVDKEPEPEPELDSEDVIDENREEGLGESSNRKLGRILARKC